MDTVAEPGGNARARATLERAGLEKPEMAWDLTCRTLEALGECLDADMASSSAAQLPDDLQGCVEGPADRDPRGEGFAPDELARRVAERVGYDLDEDRAHDHVSAVMSTLDDALTSGLWMKVLTALPPGYGARI
jgi:uncharacterized protein (DUF2267 family)